MCDQPRRVGESVACQISLVLRGSTRGRRGGLSRADRRLHAAAVGSNIYGYAVVMSCVRLQAWTISTVT